LDSAKQSTTQQEPEPEISLEEAPNTEIEAPVIEATPEPLKVAAVPAMSQPWPQARPAAPEQPNAPEPERPVLQELVSDLEASLGDDFLSPEAETAAPAPVVAPEPMHAAAQEFRSGSLDDFVSDLEASLGSDLPPVQEQAPYVAPTVPAAKVAAPMAHAAAVSAGAGRFSVAAPPVRPEPQNFHVPAATSTSPHASAGVDLADMFGELKQELEGETANTDEDPETHYNLGVAFREMGLLDEAIGEFQKVTQASEHGHPFPQLMQTYTWLAQCFLDKGIPQAAIRWYETALKMPTIDQETRTALHYELASSLESAGNKAAALNNFLEVYGSNIDYRDVGERIKALRP